MRGWLKAHSAYYMRKTADVIECEQTATYHNRKCNQTSIKGAYLSAYVIICTAVIEDQIDGVL